MNKYIDKKEEAIVKISKEKRKKLVTVNKKRNETRQ